MVARVGEDDARHGSNRRRRRPVLELLLHLARAEHAQVAALSVRAAVAALQRVLGEDLPRGALGLDLVDIRLQLRLRMFSALVLMLSATIRNC